MDIWFATFCAFYLMIGGGLGLALARDAYVYDKEMLWMCSAIAIFTTALWPFALVFGVTMAGLDEMH